MSAPSDAVLQPVRYIRRFGAFERVLHGFLMFSFLGLAATGLPLLFSDAWWAPRLANALGGFVVAGVLHRIFATVMIAVFLLHVGKLLRTIVIDKDYGIVWGPRSMVPQPRDLKDLFGHFRWFIGQGERPVFDR